jgi:hypothetical protein
LSNSCGIDLEFVGYTVHQIFDGALHEIYCSVVVFSSVF